MSNEKDFCGGPVGRHAAHRGPGGCGQSNADAKYVILDEALADEQYVIGFRKDDLSLKEEVNKILSDMKADGSLGEISTKWFGSDVTTVPETYEKAETTDDSLQQVKDKGVLVLGLDDSFPPMGYRDDDQNIVGFDIDVATAVCERMGVELQPQPIKWSSKEMELETGNVDCLWNGFTYSEERAEAMALSALHDQPAGCGHPGYQGREQPFRPGRQGTGAAGRIHGGGCPGCPSRGQGHPAQRPGHRGG